MSIIDDNGGCSASGMSPVQPAESPLSESHTACIQPILSAVQLSLHFLWTLRLV